LLAKLISFGISREALFNLCFRDFCGSLGPGSTTGSSASDDETFESDIEECLAEVVYSEAESEYFAVVKC
jgi:hypothetical protein